jgi:hypothetical protein
MDLGRAQMNSKDLQDTVLDILLELRNGSKKSTYEDEGFKVVGYLVNSSAKYSHSSIRIDIQDKELRDYS